MLVVPFCGRWQMISIKGYGVRSLSETLVTDHGSGLYWRFSYASCPLNTLEGTSVA